MVNTTLYSTFSLNSVSWQSLLSAPIQVHRGGDRLKEADELAHGHTLTKEKNWIWTQDLTPKPMFLLLHQSFSTMVAGIFGGGGALGSLWVGSGYFENWHAYVLDHPDDCLISKYCYAFSWLGGSANHTAAHSVCPPWGWARKAVGKRERAVTWLWPWLVVQGRRHDPAPCGLSAKQEGWVSFTASPVLQLVFKSKEDILKCLVSFNSLSIEDPRMLKC